MANSRQSANISSPSSKPPTKRTRSSITEHSIQGIASSPRGGSVTYVSGTNCHPCVGSLIGVRPGIKHLQPFPKQLRSRFSVHSVQQRTFQTEARSPNQHALPLLCEIACRFLPCRTDRTYPVRHPQRVSGELIRRQ